MKKTEHNAWHDLVWYNSKSNRWEWHETWVTPDECPDLKENEIDDESR